MFAKSLWFSLIFLAVCILLSLTQAKDVCDYDQDEIEALILTSLTLAPLGSDEEDITQVFHSQ